MRFGLKKPCGNCPFRNDEGAISLEPGRLEEIKEDLLDDGNTFICHKTVQYDREELHDEETGRYLAQPEDQACVGAAIWLLKRGRPNVSMRLYQRLFEESFFSRLEKLSDKVID